VIIVKKNKFTEFLKGKGYYVLLFVGVVAIAAVAIIGSQLSAKQEQEDNEFVDINDIDDNIAAEDGDVELAENNPISEGIVNSEGDASSDVASNDDSANSSADNGTGQEVASNEDMIEMEGYEEDNVAQEEDAMDTAAAEDAVETGSASAQNEPTETVENLSFDVDDGLMWPVQGNVIMNYSMDHTIYFATLMQYKCNPAIIIDAEVGTEVKAAATGVVTSVDRDNEETGITVTMDIGDGYSVVYGQLSEDMGLEVGDLVNEGEVIATVSQPTKYYSVEGSNLYFMVKEGDETVNPMLLLR
jgi:murein DD-endopeptidase MepM/ murein hydrolase activator NlpD